MNARAYSTRASGCDVVVEGYRTIAAAADSPAFSGPTSDMDAAILSAAHASSRRRRNRPLRYASCAAGIAAIGFALLIAGHPELGAPLTVQSSPDAITAQGSLPEIPPAALGGVSQVRVDVRQWPAAAAGSTGSKLDNLILNSDPAGAELQETSAVRTGTTSADIELQPPVVDLNQPGVLERLAHDRPYHYAIIRRILAGVDDIPERAVPRWMKAQFSATDVTYSPVLLTSNPPKKELAFTLDATHYEALLTLTPDGARLFPLARRGAP